MRISSRNERPNRYGSDSATMPGGVSNGSLTGAVSTRTWWARRCPYSALPDAAPAPIGRASPLSNPA